MLGCWDAQSKVGEKETVLMVHISVKLFVWPYSGADTDS